VTERREEGGGQLVGTLWVVWGIGLEEGRVESVTKENGENLSQFDVIEEGMTTQSALSTIPDLNRYAKPY